MSFFHLCALSSGSSSLVSLVFMLFCQSVSPAMSLALCLSFFCSTVQVYMSLFGSQSACHFLFHFDDPLSHVHSVQFVSPVSSCLICACCAPVCFQFPYHSVAPCPSLCSPFLMSSRFHGYFVFSQFRLLVGFSFFCTFVFSQNKWLAFCN